MPLSSCARFEDEKPSLSAIGLEAVVERLRTARAQWRLGQARHAEAIMAIYDRMVAPGTRKAA